MLLWVDSADRDWLLFAVLVVYGVQGVVHEAAEAALAASALDRRWLADFNGLRMTADEGMKLVAPLVAAGLFARDGGGPVALLDAATFAVAAGGFASMRVREEKPARRGGSLGARGRGGRRAGSAPRRRGCGRSAPHRCCARWSWLARSPCSSPVSTGRRSTPWWTGALATTRRTRACCTR
ncbi:hypothetical protein [Streptomyces sp. NPDC093600]|uniref:hypothetical protein n=1 Tax=Streptomyces sp. NPDC093600 TaxID=3366047 RepID=UPI0038077D41